VSRRSKHPLLTCHTQDQVPRRSKHPQLTKHSRRTPRDEIRYTGLPVVKSNVESTMKQFQSTYDPVIILDYKQGQNSDRRICEMITYEPRYITLQHKFLCSCGLRFIWFSYAQVLSE
jgi:hypothetical protein